MALRQKKITIAIAEDSDITRFLIQSAIAQNQKFELWGSFVNGAELIKALANANSAPDICLVDILMPKLNGAETTKILTKKYPKIMIFGLTSLTQNPLIQEMLANGADQIFLKQEIKLQTVLTNISKEYTHVAEMVQGHNKVR